MLQQSTPRGNGGSSTVERVVLYVMFVTIAGAVSARAQQSAFEPPRWLYPSLGTPPAPPHDTAALLHVPGSRRTFTLAQTRDRINPPDWFPESHPPAPDVVVRARPAGLFACGYCHLPDGSGRSENATLTGLSADYIERQMADFRSGARRAASASAASTNMIDVAKRATSTETREAARYFARLRTAPRYTIVERTLVPRTYEAGYLYAMRNGVDSEPLGQRLIEVSNDIERHELRDPGETFTTFVPPGSIERGKRIASNPALGSPARCVTCHGASLRGTAVAPPIAGRSPAYILRQLVAFRAGTRAGPASTAMRAVTENLALDDMISVAAYAGSRRP